MNTLSQEDKAQMETDKITFQCPADWKREVQKAAIDRGQTIKELAIEAISVRLGMPIPKEQHAS